MTQAAKNYLVQVAAIIEIVKPERHIYRKREDYYVASDVAAFANVDWFGQLTNEDLKELRCKPMLMECWECGRTDYLIRLTKKGWEVASNIASEMLAQYDAECENPEYGGFWERVSWLVN